MTGGRFNPARGRGFVRSGQARSLKEGYEVPSAKIDREVNSHAEFYVGERPSDH